MRGPRGIGAERLFIGRRRTEGSSGVAFLGMGSTTAGAATKGAEGWAAGAAGAAGTAVAAGVSAAGAIGTVGEAARRDVFHCWVTTNPVASARTSAAVTWIGLTLCHGESLSAD